VSTDEQFMRLALREAEHAFSFGEIPVGAVVTHDGQVIGRGHNSKETLRDPTAHAEVIALRQAASTLGGWRLVDTTLYCTMEPCPMCAGALIQARVPRLVYGVDDPKSGAAGSVLDLLRNTQLNHCVQVTRGVLATEIGDMLSRFFYGLRQGSIPRYSEAWEQRRLAGKEDSL
jgi:tRNA(adenine34) deaminase